MDLKDMRKMQGERTEEELLEKIDKILDDARDGHYSLTSQNLEDLCEAWECIKHIRTVLERTEEELLEKIDKILDDARDGHYSLTSQNLEDLCEAWECIKHIRTVLAMDR